MVDVARLDATTWAGIGLLGLLVFGIGVGLPYLPAAKHLPYRSFLPIVLAVLGGIVAALGLGYAYDLRNGAPRSRRPPPGEGAAESRSVQAAPSFEIYDPNAPEGSERRRP